LTATVQQAKADLDSAHKEAIELMKEAEELLGKGEKQDAKVVFESALDRSDLKEDSLCLDLCRCMCHHGESDV
jgi:hypothetical protein